MKDEAIPDYSRCSLHELMSVVAHIDKERFSGRFNEVVKEIERRKELGEDEVERSKGLSAGLAIIGCCAGPVLYTLEVYCGHLLLAPDMLKDGQYGLLIFWTLPVGAILGALAGSLLPAAFDSPLIDTVGFWVLSGVAVIIMGLLCFNSPSIAVLAPIYIFPVLFIAWLGLLWGAANLNRAITKG